MLRKFLPALFIIFFLFAASAQASPWSLQSSWQQPGTMGGVDIANSKLYVADVYNHRVDVFSLDGTPLGTIGGPQQLRFPYDVDVAPDGTIFVANTYGCNIVRYSADGKLLRRYGKYGIGPGQLRLPNGVDTGTNTIWIADTGNNRVQVLNYNNKPVRSFRSKQTESPTAISLYNNKVYLAENVSFQNSSGQWSASNQAEIFTSKGALITSFAPWGYGDGQANNARAIVAGSNGIYLASGFGVQLFSLAGSWQETVVSALQGPVGLAVSDSQAAVSWGASNLSVYQP